jgi:hypothetical protein
LSSFPAFASFLAPFLAPSGAFDRWSSELKAAA